MLHNIPIQVLFEGFDVNDNSTRNAVVGGIGGSVIGGVAGKLYGNSKVKKMAQDYIKQNNLNLSNPTHLQQFNNWKKSIARSHMVKGALGGGVAAAGAGYGAGKYDVNKQKKQQLQTGRDNLERQRKYYKDNSVDDELNNREKEYSKKALAYKMYGKSLDNNASYKTIDKIFHDYGKEVAQPVLKLSGFEPGQQQVLDRAIRKKLYSNKYDKPEYTDDIALRRMYLDKADEQAKEDIKKYI